MKPLDEWDAAYLEDVIASQVESARLEKKASAALTFKPNGELEAKSWERLAKQVSAFSNTGDGFLVYGIDKAGNLDSGVPAAVGREPLKEWVEKVIPTLLNPPVTGCAAKAIQVTANTPGNCVLVVFIPLSERRPHWTMDKAETAFVRTGEHSSPMQRQTMFDIASRQTVPLVSIGPLQAAENNVGRDVHQFALIPTVRLDAGAACREWAMEIHLTGGAIFHGTLSINGAINAREFVSIPGQLPLLPKQLVRPIATGAILVEFPKSMRSKARVTIKVFAGPFPVEQEFSVDQFKLV